MQYLRPKVRVVYWVAHLFGFDLPEGLRLFTHAITIQNLGSKSAESIEIAHNGKPDLFKLQPALSYEEETTPAGDHIIRVPNLGPKEFFTIEFLGYKQLPNFLYVRSKDGAASLIPIFLIQALPKWVYTLVAVLMAAGAGLIIFWLVRLLDYLYGLLFAAK